ncbi:MAG TPA: EAL domain-containing protein [Burkholderiaceae bacterium]|jgi:diguanylate cyclase (GGDEF)-like protein/PAS domain S-box-containing protein
MERLKTLLFGKEKRIGRKLTALIIAFSSVVTLFISVIQLTIEYKGLRSAIGEQLEGISIYVPSIAGSVWDFDEKQIQRALDALILLPNIARVQITTSDTNKSWSAGTNHSPNVVTQTYILQHEAKDKVDKIGTLTVVASLDAIYWQVAASAISIVLSNGMKTLLVALFMVYLIRQLITTRLEKMANKMRTLIPSMHTLNQVVETPQQPLPQFIDELDAIDWTLDRTTENLDIAIATLLQVNEELKNQIAGTEAILQNALVGIIMICDNKILVCNRRCEEIFGYAEGEMLGQSTRILHQTEDDFIRLNEQAYSNFSQGLNFSCILMLAKRDGSSFWGEITGRILDPALPSGRSTWIYTDVSERKSAEEKISFVAYHDLLTELPNRLLLEDRFQQAIAYADRDGSKVALIFLDLDNFKTINDSLGHSVGDKLIQKVAQRLSECLREIDTICRQGGDEFLIVLPSLADADALAPIAAKIASSLFEPFGIEGNQLTTSASLGVAIYPDDGADFNTLTKKADMAMYRAKNAGRNTYRFFDAQMDIDAIEQLNMSNGLRQALERQEFVLHYQPQIDLASNRLIGVEALIRWNHPELGMILPNRFIPVAENNGLIVPIGEWVLHEACRQAAEWQLAGIDNIVIAVNMSALQFKHGNLEHSITSALRKSGLAPAFLELELTESILIHDTESVLATVKRLKLLGINLSIDDFGTGYSSLSYLKRFDVDKLKIDQSFIHNLETHPEDEAIIRAIIQMAQSLGLRTIAEGVEKESVASQLRMLGCDEVQGYFFARPMSAESFSIYYQKTA